MAYYGSSWFSRAKLKPTSNRLTLLIFSLTMDQGGRPKLMKGSAPNFSEVLSLPPELSQDAKSNRWSEIYFS